MSSKFKDLSFSELFQKLVDAYDEHSNFLYMNDQNMANAWLEQIEFIKEELKRRGFIK